VKLSKVMGWFEVLKTQESECSGRVLMMDSRGCDEAVGDSGPLMVNNGDDEDDR
jgi:hypothetical protein